jgi:large subunit ribosomal protein L25
MKLSVFPRTLGKKSEVNKIRREGNIPGVIYGRDPSRKNIFLKGEELQAFLRGMRSGLLATTLFELQDGKETFKALVKEVQYHPVTYAILHMDFLVVDDQVPVAVNVPIQIAGLAECVGVKLGGFMRQVIRSMKVSCLPRNLPREFILDVSELGVAQTMRLSAIAIPEGVKPLAKMNEVAVVIAKKA